MFQLRRDRLPKSPNLCFLRDHESDAKIENAETTRGKDPTQQRVGGGRQELDRLDRGNLEQFERASRNAHIAGMSRSLVHDIKNLMMATSANLEIIDLDLEELVASSLTEDTRQRAHDAQLAVEQVAEICDDLVRYASAAEQPAERVEVTEAVQAAVRLLPRDARKRIDVLVAPEGTEELTVELDPMALRQVVYNLLLNAVDATAESGKITVEVGRWEDATALDGHVVASPARGAPLTFMRVSNDGQTLPASLVREVFQPFFSTKPGSRGLGLPAVLRAVRLLGGGLSLSTGPNRTTFTVAFSADDPDGHQTPVH